MQVHSNEPMAYLVCGRPQNIESNPKPNKIPTKPNLPKIDLSYFPPPVVKGKAQPSAPEVSKVPVETPRYNKLKNDIYEISVIENNLKTYHDNRMRKKEQIHEDWEDRYVKPFQREMRSKLHGAKYTDYKRGKNSALSTCRVTNPQLRVMDDEDFVPPPSLHVNTSRLDDRVHKYQKHAKREQKLVEFINEKTNGNQKIDENKKLENNYFNVNSKVLPETRFFGGPQDVIRHKGTKIFPQKFSSCISETLNQF